MVQPSEDKAGDTDEDQLSIKTLIRMVTDQLIESRDERLAAGRPAVFEVQDLTLEISFIATRSKAAEGGFQFWVVKAGGNIKHDDQSVHKVTLKLKTAEPSVNEPFGLADKLRPNLPGS